jgi:hemin uptake protein HemP
MSDSSQNIAPNASSQKKTHRPSHAHEPPTYDSESLFQGSRVVVIAHAGDNYRLLLTRNNRLILQK